MLGRRWVDPTLVEARATTRRVARTFALACRVLPHAVRDDVHRLYLVFRTLDDLVDTAQPDAAERLQAVRSWCAGAPAQSRETCLLDELASRRAIPREAMHDFCAGMQHDLDNRPVVTEADLNLYCYRVAGTVGIVMARVLGTQSAAAADPHAAALGMAMQRTNILRDIDEDRERGRAYLPDHLLAQLEASPPSARRGVVLRDQILAAEALYDEGAAGIPLLRSGRGAIRAAAAMYREILRQVDAQPVRPPGRAVVRPARRVVIGLGAAVSAPTFWPRGVVPTEPAPSSVVPVDTAAQPSLPAPALSSEPESSRAVEEPVGRLL